MDRLDLEVLLGLLHLLDLSHRLDLLDLEALLHLRDLREIHLKFVCVQKLSRFLNYQ